MSTSQCSRSPGWFEPLPLIPISPAALLLVFALLLAVARSVTYFEPMDRDLGNYATIAHEMHFGKNLYSDFPDQKPPAIHLTYYVAETIAGYGRAQIYLLTVAGSVLMLLATYAACVEWFGSRAVGLWAAALWALISGHVELQGNQPNAELFMNGFTMLGIFCLVRGSRMPSGWRHFALAGLCFGWAILYKYIIGVTPALIGLAYFAVPPAGKSRQRAFCEMALVGGVILAVVALTVGVLWARGQLPAFFDCVVKYNSSYAGRIDNNFRRSLPLLFPPWMWITLPLMGAGILGMIHGLVRKQWAQVAWLFALMVGTQIAVTLPGRFFPHYYQLWFPFLILGSAYAMAGLGAVATTRRLMPYVGVLVFGMVAAQELPNYLLSADQWSQVKFGPTFVYADAVARLIDSSLKPNETFFQMAEETELYPLTKRRPPSRFLGMMGVYEGPFAKRFRKELIADLTKSKPDLIVSMFSQPFPELTAFMKENYTQLPTGTAGPPPVLVLPDAGLTIGVEVYCFFVRRGSDLERRYANRTAKKHVVSAGITGWFVQNSADAQSNPGFSENR